MRGMRGYMVCWRGEEEGCGDEFSFSGSCTLRIACETVNSAQSNPIQEPGVLASKPHPPPAAALEKKRGYMVCTGNYVATNTRKTKEGC
jgi:hypothetical protein